MITSPKLARHRIRTRYGFSVVEILIASAVAASIFTAGAMMFNVVGVHKKRLATFGPVQIGELASESYYDLENTIKIDSYFAPNYGRASHAELVRDRFLDDLDNATAVYCLGRAGLNKTGDVPPKFPRPTYVPISPFLDGRQIDTPTEFLDHLNAMDPDINGENIYTAYRGACGTPNGSIFVLQPSAFVDQLAVRAIYEIDLLYLSSEPSGTYASVKRYSQGDLTDYYDVFYPTSGVTASTVYPTATGATAFVPLFVHFERAALLDKVEGAAIDRFKVAAESPFYFVWWPDPAAPSLESESFGGSFLATDPRSAYAHMAGRSSFFFVVPAYPNL